MTVSRRVVCVSISGDDPATTMVSASAPTRRSALIGMTPDPETVTSSRCTVVNPPRENFTTYVPGGRVTMRYWPVPSVTTVRSFSVSAGLDASTVTPGRTAPDESLTTPAMVACANATRGRTSTAASTTRALTELRTLSSITAGLDYVFRLRDRQQTALHNVQRRDTCSVSTPWLSTK